MDGRVVILTGAAGGIGRAITERLLADGHFVAAVDQDAAALTRLSGALQPSMAARVHSIEADLASEEQCGAAVEATAARFGRVEALINNAGIGVSAIRPDAEARPPAIEELTSEIWDRFFAVNLRAAMLMTRAALPHMKAIRWGRIVNNTTSFHTMLRTLPYGASKAAMEAMSAVWAKELTGTGITVNVLIPGGPTDTEFIGGGSGIPRHRMLKPTIMGPPVSWLISDASMAMSGKRIIAGHWDNNLVPEEAAVGASRAVGWPELTTDVVWPKDEEP